MLERRGNVLRVNGLDAIDGSLVLDIKPELPDYHVSGDVRIPNWMQELRREFADHPSDDERTSE